MRHDISLPSTLHGVGNLLLEWHAASKLSDLWILLTESAVASLLPIKLSIGQHVVSYKLSFKLGGGNGVI